MVSKINLVGLELEGYFADMPTLKGSFKTDSSVDFDGQYRANNGSCDNGCRDDCDCWSCTCNWIFLVCWGDEWGR